MVEVRFNGLWGEHGLQFRYGRGRRHLPSSSVKSTAQYRDWGERCAVNGNTMRRVWTVEYGFHSTPERDGTAIIGKRREHGSKHSVIIESLLQQTRKSFFFSSAGFSGTSSSSTFLSVVICLNWAERIRVKLEWNSQRKATRRERNHRCRGECLSGSSQHACKKHEGSH